MDWRYTIAYCTRHFRMASIFFLALFLGTACAEQYFIRQPSNVTVRVGKARTNLQCIIGNRQTDLQWTKDGFGLGTRNFPDPRYSIPGDYNQGMYNLQIVNIQLSDDGAYQCQAGADFRRGIGFLQSRVAYLNVIVPPKNIILDPSVAGTISVTYPNTVIITCSTPETKPASVIMWRVGGTDYSGQISKKISSKPGSKLVTTSSTIYLRPDKIENGSLVECVVSHEAMDVPVSSTATLNVMYPPRAPVISGFSGEPVKAGDDVTMRCEAIGGNPLSEITWLIDEEVINKDYRHVRDKSYSVLQYRVRPQDHGKAITCRASNPALDVPMETHATLEVYYPPEELIMERDPLDGAPETGAIEFICHYAHSNPRASLEWLIDGLILPQHWDANLGTTPYLLRTLDIGASSERISLTLTSLRREDAKSKVTCRASIPEIDYRGEVSAHPIINFPPRKVDVTVFYLSTPVTIPPNADSHSPLLRGLSSGISGKSNSLEENTAFKAGDIIQLKCEARGGNPPPDLNWFYEDGRPITSGKGETISAPEVKVYTGASTAEGAETGEFITTTTLELALEPEHNGIFVRCRAGHSGYAEIVSDREQLKVVFPPTSLSIEQFPSSPVAGKPMSLTCTTASSNPASKITWYHKNEKLPDHWSVDIPPRSGSNHGFVSSSRLQMIPSVEDDGNDVTCKAEVEVLRESVTQPFRLRIQYSPVIYVLNGNDTFNVTESAGSVEIKAIARANPDEVTYSWFRLVHGSDQELIKRPLTPNNRISWTPDSGFLKIENIRLDDDGLYQIQASNEQGTSEKNITLNVFYPVSVKEVSGPDYPLQEGETARLRCEFKSHPRTPVKVSWVKMDPGKGRKSYDVTTHVTYSVLNLINVTADDRGSYKCVVNNGIGAGDEAKINLDILYAPIFVESSPSKVAVSSVSEDGTLSPKVVLPCIVNSRPAPTFTWFRGNETIVPTPQNIYSILRDSFDFETYRSSLRVTRIPDYDKNQNNDGTVAEFACESSNAEGARRKQIKIVFRGPPDAPSDVSVLNVSHDVIEVSWKRGFDGGVDQSFIVFYQKYNPKSRSTRYKEVKSETNRIVLADLDSDQEYLIHVLAQNDYGQSNASETISVKTSDSYLSELSGGEFGLTKNYIIAIAIVGTMTLVFLIAIAIFMTWRCRVSKNSYKPKTIETDCDSLEHESSISSCGSTKKRRDSDRPLGTIEEKERLTNNEDDSPRSSDRRGMQYDKLEMIPLTKGMNLQQDSCYLDCSVSRCGSIHTVEPHDVERCQSSMCSFRSCQDEISAMPTYAQINRFHSHNQSARIPRSVSADHTLGLPRNSSEPRFRQDVPPLQDPNLRSSTAFTNDHYDRESVLSRPADLPLPPSLPLYDHLPYNLRPGLRASNDALNDYSQSGSEFSRGQGIRNSTNYRPYRTLESGSVKFDRFAPGNSAPGGNMGAHHTMGRAPCSYWSSRDDISSQTSCSASRPSDTCMYNVVSRPDTNCGYTSSLSSVQGNDQYEVNANKMSTESPNYAQTSGSGLYVKSIDNIGDYPRRMSIVNDDGTINTYGFDHPTSSINNSRSNILDSVRESQSQDPLPCFPSSSSSSQDARRNSPRPLVENGLPNFSRHSMRTTQQSERFQGSPKRGPTPPVRFRDELSLAISNGSRSTLPSSSRRQESPSDSHQPVHSRHSSDDDMDSGCGGSADAVVVDLDRSPLTPSDSSSASASSPLKHARDRLDATANSDEPALFV